MFKYSNSFSGLFLAVAFIPLHSIYKLSHRLSVDRRPLELALALKKLSNQNDLVIVYDDGQPEVLYYSHRKGWHVWDRFSPESLEEKRTKGAKFFATLFADFSNKNLGLEKYLNINYPVAWRGSNASIYDLR